MSGLRIDHGDLDRWVLTLDEAASAAPHEVRKVVQKGALNIKTGAQQRVSGRAHLPHYPRAITYDTTVKATAVEAEIGPDKGKRQGALGNIIEYGTRNNAPIPHIRPAADEEMPRFESEMDKLAARLLEGR